MSIKSWDPDVIAQLRQFMEKQIPFNHYLGIEVVELREGFCKMRVPFRPELVGDPFRPALHGGVFSALIDACGGASVFTVVKLGDRISTIDMRVDYLRPGELKDVYCEATVSRIGNRVASTDMKIYQQDQPDQPIATGRGVYNVNRG